MSNQPAFLYTNALGTNQYPATRESITTLSYDNEVDVSCSGIGIARADRNGTVTAYYSADGTSWTEFGAMNFAANKATMAQFDLVSAQHWRVVFDAATNVGVIKVGRVLQMDQRNYGGVDPAPFNQTDSSRPSTLERGQWLGRHAHGRRASATYTATHTSMQWVKENAMDLFEALRDGEGVFYAWRPETYPGDVIYGFLASEIKPTNAGTLDFLDFDIQLTGIYDTSTPVYTGPTIVVPGS
jgi:hypothetical protein